MLRVNNARLQAQRPHGERPVSMELYLDTADARVVAELSQVLTVILVAFLLWRAETLQEL